MNLIDIVTSPWAIMPEKLIEINETYRAHMRGPKIDFQTMEAKYMSLSGTTTDFEVINGTAVIPLMGVVSKRDNFFTRIYGGAVTEIAKAHLSAAIQDDSVESIVFHIDSPGGMVDGTQDLARKIFEARGTKPIIALGDGCMCSAAMWIGAAADKAYVASKTTHSGSIGVIANHAEYSRMLDSAGITVTTLQSGKFKSVGSPYRPLSESDKNEIQAQLDYIYTLFVHDVAEFRGASVGDVLENMADGRIFIGEQAKEVGLIDGVLSFDEIIQSANNTLPRENMEASVSAPIEINSTLEEKEMDLETLKEEHPELVEQIKTEAISESKNDLIAQGRVQGVDAENERINEILAVPHAGFEDVITEVISDKSKTAGDAALQILAAQKDRGVDANTLLEENTIIPFNGQASTSVEGEQAEIESAAKEMLGNS